MPTWPCSCRARRSGQPGHHPLLAAGSIPGEINREVFAVEEIAEGTRFVIDGQVFTYIGDGEDAAGQPVAHLRGGDSDSLEEYPKDALQNLERA